MSRLPIRSLSRRCFLASLAAGAAAGSTLAFDSRSALFGEETQPDRPPRVGLGFSLYGMRSLKTADALKACAEIGYDCVELVTIEGWPCDPPALSADARRDVRTQLGDHKLALPALMENLNALVTGDAHQKTLDRLKLSAELGHALSPEKPPVIETILGGSPAKWDEVKGRIVAALKDWSKVGESTKTVVAVKPHVSGALHTPEGAAWLMEAVGSPWIRLTYDFSHYRLRDFDLPGSLTALLPLTSFIHVKDAKGSASAVQFVLPGDGDIDYVRYFTLLKEARYPGAVVVEVSGQLHTKAGYDPIAAAKRSYAHLAPAFVQAGLRGKA
jgi:sugar phosphate isomerase/epimerase